MLKKIRKLLRKKNQKQASECSGWPERISRNPLDPQLHAQYAQSASESGMHYLAYAELKTALSLGMDTVQSKPRLDSLATALPDLLEMNHNQWFRLHTLAKTLEEKAAGITRPRILDVGGGEGWLAAFIPHMDYCLVEPDINGISGTDLPFAEQSFDFVISCHVLEHIPVPSRTRYLDQLLSMASKGVILLNPFHETGTQVEDRLQLFIDITDARWAHEHLECSLPTVESVADYARAKGLQFKAVPNGSMATTVALVFMDYFAAEAHCHDKWKKINKFINSQYADIMTSELHPAAYMICLDCQ